MHSKKLISLLTLISAMLVSIAANASILDKYGNPFYIGLTAGWGSTTWGNLVPKDLSAAMNLATPTHVAEGGAVAGVYAGYEFIPQFALEASYLRYPNATLYFDEMSLFSFDHNDMTKLVTRTDRYALQGKFMVLIPHTPVRAYSSFGAAEVHRNDSVVDRWRLSPIFGVGLNYNITHHIMVELGTEYVAGYGQSELDPAMHYIPFLYSAFMRLAYKI